MHSEGRYYALMDHDIGSYFETDDASFNPNTKWGGTWELDQSGTVLVSKSNTSGSAFNVAADTVVGEEKHTLSKDEMPSHYHNGTYNFSANWRSNPEAYEGVFGTLFGPNDGQKGAVLQATDSIGGGQSHNNIQPSKVIYRWHRTA